MRGSTRRRALAHVEATVQEIHKAVTVIDEPEFRKEVLGGFMDGYAITAVYAEDVPLRALAQRRAELIRMYLDTNDLARDAALQPRHAGGRVHRRRGDEPGDDGHPRHGAHAEHDEIGQRPRGVGNHGKHEQREWRSHRDSR